MSYPEPAQKYKVSENGGHAPRWGQNVHYLYFLDSSDMVHRLQFELPEGRLRVKSAESLFRPPILAPPYDTESFDVVRDQHLFAFVTPASRNDAPYVLATSWRH